MKTQKSDFLIILNGNIDSDFQEIRDEIMEGINAGSRLYERAHKMRIWPFEVSGSIWFLAAVLIPVWGVTAITFNIGELIRLFTTVLVPVLYILINVVLRGS
ncbi:MAG: hypothetical protein HXS48_03275 [Theionarchaea archaeon]|nr:hypothetical protein [Theionarchaea archaeon]